MLSDHSIYKIKQSLIILLGIVLCGLCIYFDDSHTIYIQKPAEQSRLDNITIYKIMEDSVNKYFYIDEHKNTIWLKSKSTFILVPVNSIK